MGRPILEDTPREEQRPSGRTPEPISAVRTESDARLRGTAERVDARAPGAWLLHPRAARSVPVTH